MDFVKQLRQFLDFIDNHGIIFAKTLQFLRQNLRSTQQTLKFRWPQQVIGPASRITRIQPSGFSHLTGAPQKNAVIILIIKVNYPAIHTSYCSFILIIQHYAVAKLNNNFLLTKQLFPKLQKKNK